MEDLKTRHSDVEKTLNDCEKENTSLRRVKDNWDEDRLNLQHVIEKRDMEIARLNGNQNRLLLLNLMLCCFNCWCVLSSVKIIVFKIILTRIYVASISLHLCKHFNLANKGKERLHVK